MRKIIQYEPDANTTRAQKWLCAVINANKVSQAELAGKLHVTRGTVFNLLSGHSPMAFPYVCAICYVLKLKDDPEEVWEFIKEEKENKSD